MRVKELIAKKLLLVIQKLTDEKIKPEIKISARAENGDYSTNVAFQLALILKQKPLDIAYEIKQEFEKNIKGGKGIKGDLNSVLERVEVAPPAFINFFLSEKYLGETVEYINKTKSEFGLSEKLKGQKIMVEFTDPNPFKEFHIGHLYSNIVGESLSRLFESQGATVWRVCYQGDVGLHVAKAIYGMQKLADQMPDERAPLSVRAQFMGRAYALGSADYESNKAAERSINELNKMIYDHDESIRDLYKKGRAWSLEYFESIYKRLGTKFDRYYFESEAGEIGTKLVREFLKKNVFEESDGAIIFPGKKFGLHNRVFINSFNIPTYEAKELGLAPTKFSDFPYDLSVIITGNEVDEYFKVVLKVLELINADLARKTRHISHGMVRLPGGKMSSRTGDVVTGEWLLDEVTSRILRAYPEMDKATSEKVALAAVKYAFLKTSIGKDIKFNFEQSITLEGDSGPYVQYAYVRTKSVLEKSKKDRINGEKSVEKDGLNPEEKDILRQLFYFPEIVEQAAEKLAPNIIAEYLFGLSQRFNFFYQKHKIAGNSFRLQLTSAVSQTLFNGLRLLGIQAVEHM